MTYILTKTHVTGGGKRGGGQTLQMRVINLLKYLNFLRTELCSFWIITQRVVVIPYRRFGTTYWSHLQESIIQ